MAMQFSVDRFGVITNRKQTVMVVDDDPRVRELLGAYLIHENYNVVEISNGMDAVAYCSQNTVDLVILDIMMQGRDGFNTCKEIKKLKLPGFLPVIMLTALDDKQAKLKAYEAGADDFINKPCSRIELLIRVKSLLRIRQLSLEMENIENVLFSLVKILEARDPYTKGHSERVAKISEALAIKMGFDPKTAALIKKAALLHDIGKIGIDQNVLNKKQSLSHFEYLEIQRHPIIGEEICRPLKSLRNILPFIRHHHEKLDGSGYPDGLKAKNIPLPLRILSMADVYDALTSHRPYRNALTSYQAFKVIEKEVAKGWWDKKVFHCLKKLDPDIIS